MAISHSSALSNSSNAREEGVRIPDNTDILMPRDRILILLSEYSELDDLSDALGIPKEVTDERNVERIMIAGTVE